MVYKCSEVLQRTNVAVVEVVTPGTYENVGEGGTAATANTSHADMGFVHGEHRPLYLAHITLGRRKDPLYINMRNPIPPKSIKDP